MFVSHVMCVVLSVCVPTVCFVVYGVGFMCTMGVLGCCVQCCGTSGRACLGCVVPRGHPLLLHLVVPNGVHFCVVWGVALLPFS